MDPHALIGPISPLGNPAPYWFLVLFKVLGFILHVVPMNVLYTGLILAILMRMSGNSNAQCLAARLTRQMPFIVAWAVNLGIVPLLFTQVLYYQVFYPATILMAWPWFSIIPLLTVAYYGVYVYASGFRSQQPHLTPVKKAAGWISVLLFILIGFLFANGFSLMTNLKAWPALWQDTSVAGAPLGWALNTMDSTLWPRWLLMIGLAITTTAAYLIVDTGVFVKMENGDYSRWMARFALKIYSAGILCFAIAGSWYVFGTWMPESRQKMLGTPLIILTIATAIGPGIPWLLIAIQAKRGGISRSPALLTGLGQFAVIALNAVSRQIVQNVELQNFLEPAAQPARTQWSPLILFLVLFVAGVGLLIWMIGKTLAAFRQPASQKT